MGLHFAPVPRKERVRKKTIKSANYVKGLFKDSQSEEYLALDLEHSWKSSLWITNEEKRKIWHRRPIESKAYRILIKALRVAGENNCLNKPMDKEEFKQEVARGDSTIYPGAVNNWLKGNPGKQIFKTNFNEIKLNYPLKEIWGMENND